MIVVIGGVKIKLQVKMGLPQAPNQENWTEQLEGETAGDAFEEMQARMRAEQERFWQGESHGNQPGFMGLADFDGTNDDITVKSCGCAFNVARHLADMGREVKLISVVGIDPLGLATLEEMRSHGIDTSHVAKIDGQTPVVFEIRNFAGEVEFARANESLIDRIDPSLIASSADDIAKAGGDIEAIMMDGSIPAETMRYITDRFGNDVKIFFDPASRMGGEKISATADEGLCIMNKLYCVMPGRVEAEKMAEMIILGPDKLQAAADLFAENGVERTFITIKAGGVYYKDAGSEEGRAIRPERTLSFADTSGTGDFVSAVIIDETLKGTDMDATAKAAMDAAAEFLSELSDERPY